MGRHDAPPATYDAIVSDYVTGRAKELVRQFEASLDERRRVDWDEWIGAAAEILRELTRDA